MFYYQILCKIVSDSQLFLDKTMFLEKKAQFFGSKTVDQRFGANLMQTLKNLFFAKICNKFLAFFRFFAAKTLKMTLSTSIWSEQHPNAG